MKIKMVVLLTLVGLLAVLFLTTGTGGVSSSPVSAFSSPTPASDNVKGYHYGVRNLVGATPEQVAQYALEYAMNKHDAVSGTPQILTFRSVTNDELGELGLPCITFLVQERPALVLVILEGDFQSRYGANEADSGFIYLAYVFDTWSAEATGITVGRNDSIFRLALGEPTLPPSQLTKSKIASQLGHPYTCPTEAPTQRHYGDIAPTAESKPFHPMSTMLPTTPTAVPTMLPSPKATQDQ